MTSLTDKMELIKIAVNRFLGWKLPDDFSPDGGISFKKGQFDTIGTNLFTAQQAQEMFEYVLDTNILAEAEAAVVGDYDAELKRFAEMWDKGEFEWNHHEGDKIGKKPVSIYRIFNCYIKPLLAAKDRDIAEAYAQGWNEGQIDLSARLKI